MYEFKTKTKNTHTTLFPCSLGDPYNGNGNKSINGMTSRTGQSMPAQIERARGEFMPVSLRSMTATCVGLLLELFANTSTCLQHRVERNIDVTHLRRRAGQVRQLGRSPGLAGSCLLQLEIAQLQLLPELLALNRLVHLVRLVVLRAERVRVSQAENTFTN
jgi:hypothetical protein